MATVPPASGSRSTSSCTVEYVGVDFGGSGVRIAAGPRLKVSLLTEGTQQATERFLLDTIAELLRPYSSVRNVGVALPMTFIGIGHDRRLARQQSKFIPLSAGGGRRLADIEHRWQAHLGVPVHLINDADAATLHLALAAKASGTHLVRDTAVISLGSSVGVGFVLEGRLYVGPFTSNASHTIVAASGPRCTTCHQVGCWKMQVGSEARDALAAAVGLWCAPRDRLPSVREIAVDARRGVSPALEWMNMYAARIAIGVAQLVQFFPVARVVLTGGVARHCPGLVPLVRRELRARRVIAEELSRQVSVVQMHWLSPARGAQLLAQNMGLGTEP